MTRREIMGWGRWPRHDCNVFTPSRPDELATLVSGMRSGIARGLGRSYGDSALNPDCVIDMRKLDRMISFDEVTGVLVAEAGVSMADVISAFLQRGFFPNVTPGTKFVTLGGALAADAHGKNHHRDGSFGDHVEWFDLLCSDGEVRRCSPLENVNLFNLTPGGMGLTGVVLRMALRLRPVTSGWIKQRKIVAPDLQGAIQSFEDNLDSMYSVAWIDCLASGSSRGRSLVYLGEHADPDDLSSMQRSKPFRIPDRQALRVPVDAPSFSLNRYSVSLFNAAYFKAGQRSGDRALVDWDRYFYPLDALRDWNRIYGRKGFAQYQCALPLATAQDALIELLDSIVKAGQGSFLAVLKRFGPGAPQRPFSFPFEGYTLALDFPINKAALCLMLRLDRITEQAGGRLYLAKDSRMSPEMFRAGYGRACESLRQLRESVPSKFVLESIQSRRLGL